VTSSPQDDGKPGAAEQPSRLVLELCIADCDPLCGTVGVIGGLQAVAFHGWMDLMGAINSLRAATGGTGRNDAGGD
jgi:hypothetical protein